MIKKWLELDIFYKGVTLSVVYTAIALVISLVLLVVDSSWLYGGLMGVAYVYLSYLIIWLLLLVLPKEETSIGAVASLISWGTRVALWAVAFTTTLFAIAPAINGTGLLDIDNVFHPINTLWMLFIYLIPTYAYFTVPVVEWRLNKKLDKK